MEYALAAEGVELVLRCRRPVGPRWKVPEVKERTVLPEMGNYLPGASLFLLGCPPLVCSE